MFVRFRLSTVVIMLFISLFVTACARAPMSAGDAPALSVPVELTYWYTLTGPAAEGQLELVDRFNESQDRIVVTPEFQGSYSDLATAILTAFAASDGPDVSLLGTFEIREFQRSGVLANVKPFMDGENGLDTSGWPQEILAAGAFDDGIYWLPFNVSAPVLYYNSEALEEIGATPPATWDEFFDLARDLTVKNADGSTQRYGVAYIPGWFSWAMTSAIWSEGGEITTRDYSNITINDPVIVRLLTEFQDLIKDGAAILPDSASGGHRGMFKIGQAAMILDSPAPFGEIFEQSVGFTPAVANYPAGSAGKVYNVGGGGIIMSAIVPEDRRDAAWEFMRFMLTDESIAYYAERSGYVAFSSGAQELAQDFLQDERYATIHAAVPYLRGDFSVNFSPAVRNNFDRAWQSIFVDLVDVQTALDTADAEAEEQIKNEE
jgi:sn-glycerol 3-phosphate transport system substrate-binding protein